MKYCKFAFLSVFLGKKKSDIVQKMRFEGFMLFIRGLILFPGIIVVAHEKRVV